MSRHFTERRKFIKDVASLGLFYPLSTIKHKPGRAEKKLTVVCVGGHPDDPESGCGGTLSLYAQAGHSVSIVYLTRGEAGIQGKNYQEAAAIRTKESEAACKIIGATPYFLGQTDGSTHFDKEAIKNLHELLQKIKPDILFTHWPIDTHPDHQVASLLSYQCWLRMKKSFPIYYFEVDSGFQTMHFSPTDYIDITPVAEQKKRALYQHTSQNPDDIYLNHHLIMQRFRGREINAGEAEAFVRLDAYAHEIKDNS
ncbi:MAG: PIG-L family deacetylase [Flavisolibacter sp.]|nr:PIG-L family deacetylase [Flavisolibacter sp.]